MPAFGWKKYGIKSGYELVEALGHVESRGRDPRKGEMHGSQQDHILFLPRGAS